MSDLTPWEVYISQGRKIYTHIENHCKRASEVEKAMGVEDVREFREELERREEVREFRRCHSQQTR